MKNYDIQSNSYLWGLIKKEVKIPRAAAGTVNKKGLIAQIVGEFKDKTRSDIKKWRGALDSADNYEDPRWFILQDLYDNLATDGHIQALVQIRKAAVTGN